MIPLKIIVAGIGLLVLLTIGVCVTWNAASWWKGRETKDAPPTKWTPEQIIDLIDDTEPARGFSLTESPARVVREGTAPAGSEDSTAVEEFAAAVLDTSPPLIDAHGEMTPALLPPARTWRDDDRGGFAVIDSRNQWVTREWECPEGRRFEAGTRGTEMYSNCERTIPGLLPNLGKSALRCAAFAGAGYGIAWGVQQPGRKTDPVTGEKEELAVDPLLVGAGAAGGCVILEILH